MSFCAARVGGFADGSGRLRRMAALRADGGWRMADGGWRMADGGETRREVRSSSFEVTNSKFLPRASHLELQPAICHLPSAIRRSRPPPSAQPPTAQRLRFAPMK